MVKGHGELPHYRRGQCRCGLPVRTGSGAVMSGCRDRQRRRLGRLLCECRYGHQTGNEDVLALDATYPLRQNMHNVVAEFRSLSEREEHQCGNRLRFDSAQAGRHASELEAERLHTIDRKRWLLEQAAG